MMISIGKLRLRVRSSVRPIRNASSGRNDSSQTASHSGGSAPAAANATRPASHSIVSATSGAPAKPRVPVQLGTAVSRKPAIAAPMKPNSISWPCHRNGGSVADGTRPVAKIHTQPAIAMTA